MPEAAILSKSLHFNLERFGRKACRLVSNHFLFSLQISFIWCSRTALADPPQGPLAVLVLKLS